MRRGKPNPRFVFARAGAEDSAELSEIFRATPMAGGISIRMERDPDFFAGAAVQAEEPCVLLVRDLHRGRIAGVGACGRRSVHMDGEIRSVPLLGDLRLLPEYRQGPLLLRAFEFLREVAWRPGDFAQQIIVRDNTPALRLLCARPRKGLPTAYAYGSYASPAVSLQGGVRQNNSALDIRRATSADAADMQMLLDSEGPRKRFFPAYDMAGVGSRAYYRDLAFEDFYLAYEGNCLVGMAGIWDQGGFKRTRVMGYAPWLRFLRPMHNAWARLRGGLRLPPPGEALRCLHLHTAVMRDNRPDIFRAILARIRRDHSVASRRMDPGEVGKAEGAKEQAMGYDFLLGGFDTRDPLLEVLRELPHQDFGGKHYVVSWEGDPRLRFQPGPYGDLFYLEAARI